ncbi:MAG TPA: glutamate--cysteine ligase [Amnibacterium sp.]
MRTFGVEEELLLVDGSSGRPVPVAPQVLEADERAGRRGGGALTAEMHQEMIEAVTRPTVDAVELAQEAAGLRSAADIAARSAGARVAALAASPLRAEPHPTPSRRYQTMMGAYGALPRHSLACALHVHVGIESGEEGVAVLDRIRPWLPLLVALTANSPFCQGEDTGHASWRTIAWNQWPCAGPTDVFGSLQAYRAFEQRLLDSGVVLDAGMLYFAARLSRNNPTLEVRVADVPLDVGVTATVAALVRAMVDTAAAEWRAGDAVPEVPTGLLRLASWHAALCGIRGTLVDPLSGLQAPAVAVLGRLLGHVQPALEANGDDRLVLDGLCSIVTGGTGADLQRRAYHGPKRMGDVVRMAVERTTADHVLPPHSTLAPEEFRAGTPEAGTLGL